MYNLYNYIIYIIYIIFFIKKTSEHEIIMKSCFFNQETFMIKQMKIISIKQVEYMNKLFIFKQLK